MDPYVNVSGIEYSSIDPSTDEISRFLMVLFRRDYRVNNEVHFDRCSVYLGEYPKQENGNRHIIWFSRKELNCVYAFHDYERAIRCFAELVYDQKRINHLIASEPYRADIDLRPITSGCGLLPRDKELHDKVVIIKQEHLPEMYRTPVYQLRLCVSGYGASPNGRGTYCYCANLRTGRVKVFDRDEILGTMEESTLPEWARNGLAVVRLTNNYYRKKAAKESARCENIKRKMRRSAAGTHCP